MENNLKIYLDYIFKSFQGCRAGEGGFFPRAWSYDKDTTQPFKSYVFCTLNILMQNGFIHTTDPSRLPFLKLTQSGYDYMQGGELNLSKLDLSQLIDLSIPETKIYELLWLYIGKQGEAPLYLTGPEYYKVIAPFVGLTSYTYSQYIQKCLDEDRGTSRISLFRELFMKLATDQIEPFLKDLSKTILSIYQPTFQTVQSEDSTPAIRQSPSNRPVIFISYTWETNITHGHMAWVRKLADELVRYGFDVRFDQYQLLGTEMNHFMAKSVRDADRILLICTPEFKRRSDNMEKACGLEASLISKDLISDITSTKFLPIVRIGEPQDVMPDYLGNRNALIWHDTDDDAGKLDILISDLRRAASKS